MTLKLTKKVVRVTTGKFKDGGREKHIEIALLPGDTIQLRYLRTEDYYEASIGYVMERAQILKAGIPTAPQRRKL